MARAYISIGSNIDREQSVTAALDALQAAYGELIVSTVFESEAVGFEGDSFLNLVVGVDTSQTVAELAEVLRKIEDDCGRSREVPRFSARTMDLDLLTYGELTGSVDGIVLPREEITRNAFVLRPLAEVAGAEVHPVEQRSYASLWRDFDDAEQRLWAVDFGWNGRQISKAGL